MLDQQRDYVLRTVEERGVRLVRLWFTDVLGNLKSFAISPAELENALEDGMTFDGSSIDGFSPHPGERRARHPRPDTFEVLPWGDAKARRGAGVLRHPQPRRHAVRRRPAPGAAPQRCRPPTSRATRSTSRPTSSSSTSSRRRPGSGRSRSTRAASSTSPRNDVAGILRKQTIRTLETMGIPVEYSFHEDAPSQQEIDLRHTDALTMADSVMTFRLVVKEVAAVHGVHATFMPKPLEGVQGSGMHIHLSLFRGDENAFFDGDDPYHLSAVAKSFMAGLLRHAAEITAITNQTVNSYKRLVPGLRGAGPRVLGPQQPQRADPGADRQARQPDRHPHRVPLARPGVQPVPRVQRDAGRRHARRRRGLRAAAPRPTPTCSRSTTRRSPSSASTSSRSRWPTRCDAMEKLASSSTRRSASTSSSGSCATSAREWRGVQDPRQPRSSSTAT